MYDTVWLYDIFILEFWHIISIIFSLVFLAYIYINARKSKLLYYYMALHSILLVWLAAKVLKTIAPTADLKWFFIAAQYFAVCFLGSVFLMFAYLYARGQTMSMSTAVLINIPPAFFFVVVVTNHSHHLFYSTYDFLGDTFGPLFYAYMIFTYLYLAAGIYLCATGFSKQFGKKKIQARFFIGGIMLPLFVNILYVSGITEPRFDITPVTTNISLLFFAYAVYKYQFLDIVPAGIFLSLNRLKEGVLVVDEKNNIIYRNSALQRILQPAKSLRNIEAQTVSAANNAVSSTDDDFDNNNLDVGDEGDNDEDNNNDSDNYNIMNMDTVTAVDNLLHKLSGSQNVIGEMINRLDIQTREQRRELLISEQSFAGIYAKLLPVKNNSIYLIVFSDITEYRRLIDELEHKNTQLAAANNKMISYKNDLRRLALIEERNRIAGEIHDILGHSLTLILNLLETGCMMLAKDRKAADKKIRQVVTEAKYGMAEIDRLFAGGESTEGGEKTVSQLQVNLNQIADKFRGAGLRVTIDVSHANNSISEEIFTTLMRMVQEALANSLKHGRAEKVDIIIRSQQEKMDIFIVDNGSGCSKLQKGNGLQGMEERIKNISGEFACGSPGDGGFNIHAVIPVSS